MPIYEYECAACRKVHEVMQKFSDAPMGECPDCNGPVAKIMSRTSFALKGTGWYTTDYKRASGPKTEEKAAPSDAAKSEVKSEVKPETKTGASGDAKSEPSKSEAKTEAKPEASTAAKSEAKPAPKSENKPASRT